jgi:hypothetical protein
VRREKPDRSAKQSGSLFRKTNEETGELFREAPKAPGGRSIRLERAGGMGQATCQKLRFFKSQGKSEAGEGIEGAMGISH